MITDQGLAAIGFKPKPAGKESRTTDNSVAADQPARQPRDSKQAQLVAMLQRPDGASIVEIAETFGWAAHTVRGVIAGVLKKKLGLNVISEKIDDRRVYRIKAEG